MQGYITLATGERFYLEMAINLALSLRLNDPGRPLCIVTDPSVEVPAQYLPFIDKIVHLEPLPGFHGCLNKLRLQRLSPYEETMFVDADCVLVKNDMDRHWQKFGCAGFNIAGDKVRDGEWYQFSVADVLAKLGIDYMVKMNSGVFYFRKGEASEKFFATTLDLVETHKTLLGVFHRNRLQLADEPFIGAALGKLGIDPVSYRPEDGSIMITTVRSEKEAFDPFSRTSRLTKNSDYRLLGRFFPRRQVVHSPSLAHFVKLKPKSIYRQISADLRKHFGVDDYSF